MEGQDWPRTATASSLRTGDTRTQHRSRGHSLGDRMVPHTGGSKPPNPLPNGPAVPLEGAESRKLGTPGPKHSRNADKVQG